MATCIGRCNTNTHATDSAQTQHMCVLFNHRWHVFWVCLAASNLHRLSGGKKYSKNLSFATVPSNIVQLATVLAFENFFSPPAPTPARWRSKILRRKLLVQICYARSVKNLVSRISAAWTAKFREFSFWETAHVKFGLGAHFWEILLAISAAAHTGEKAAEILK